MNNMIEAIIKIILGVALFYIIFYECIFILWLIDKTLSDYKG